MSNPLLQSHSLPAFSEIKPGHIEPAIDHILAENRQAINRLLEQDSFTWENLIHPLELLDVRLHNTWSPVLHMHSVVNTEELRAAYQQCLPKLSDYHTELGHNKKLYHAFVAISESPEFADFDATKQKVINDALRDFRLSGIGLNDTDKQHFQQLERELSELTTKFEQNLLDATDAWSKHITEEVVLTGLPEHAKQAAHAVAQQRDLSGWVLTLEFPCYYAVMNYADSRSLREEIYAAYATRASDQGPNAGKWDNSEVMNNIVRCRHEIAQLLGFDNYADYSLATKMADDSDTVINFLKDLRQRSYAEAKQDFAELCEFAARHHDMPELKAWDIPYYSEKLQLHKYHLSQEELRPYFPEDKVLSGMFATVGRLYGMNINEVKNIDTWHPDVRFFEVYDATHQLRGKFYIDLYARANKRGGAWMDDCRQRHINHQGDIEIPVAYLVCNFAGPSANKPALFTHEEVITLFHEFGHGLHHMLTQIDHLDISGINGVEWDAVELPSQFMENWCWQKEALALISGHYETGEPIPDELFNKMIAAKNFQSAMQMVRQVEFSLFDFYIYKNYSPEKGARIQETLDAVRKETAVVPIPEFNRFQHSFSHIFAGGYAAGYYSYKWAEVLSSDAFSKFEENGIFDQQTGQEFLHCILEKGGSAKPMDLFVAFRGREPNIDALLRHSGIA